MNKAPLQKPKGFGGKGTGVPTDLVGDSARLLGQISDVTHINSWDLLLLACLFKDLSSFTNCSS